jgi:hypothetical protein
MAYETVADIISDAAKLVGIATADIANPITSGDPNILLMLYLLKAAGRELVREHQWSQLQSEHSFTTVNGTATYAMPADFDRHIDQSQWNTDAMLQLGGPVNAQEWRALKALNTASSPQFYFRTKGTSLILHPTPTDAQDLVLEYMSTYWVQASGSANRDKSKPTVATDTLWFDSTLLVQRLRLDWMQAKGLDSTQAENAYIQALATAKSSHSASPVLSLARSASRSRMVGYGNLPPSGWGV